MCNKLNTPHGLCGDRRRELLRQGLVCRFMGREWRLLAGEVIEDALREGWREGGGPTDREDVFLDWVLEGDRLAEFLPAALGMDSAADDLYDKLRGAVDELLERCRHETTVQTPGRPDGRPAC